MKKNFMFTSIKMGNMIKIKKVIIIPMILTFFFGCAEKEDVYKVIFEASKCRERYKHSQKYPDKPYQDDFKNCKNKIDYEEYKKVH